MRPVLHINELDPNFYNVEFTKYMLELMRVYRLYFQRTLQNFNIKDFPIKLCQFR